MKRKWWHDAIAYQVYPKSFYDTNGDGIGDVQGILEKLDYLQALGINLLWLSPIYPSPMADQGYDISDYYDIDPRFGTLADVDALIAEAKKRGIRILMDLVVNHCSDEHEWFRKAVEDPYGQYGAYFWIRSKNPDGSMPTNWRSFFGGSAWEALPGHPDLVYLHSFHRKQPDLNWENPALREEIYRNINWWLDRGLGGFRLDAITYIKKPAVLKSYPADRADGTVSIHRMVQDAAGLYDLLREMQARTFALHDSFTVGEVCHVGEDALKESIGENGCFSSVFDFEADDFGFSDNGWYDRQPCLPEDFKQAVFRAQKGPGSVGFLSTIIENHDEARGVSRYIPAKELSDAAKKALGCAYFFTRGIPFIYEGQEIGMENRHFRDISELDDINSINEYRIARRAGLSDEEALRVVSAFSRDNARTPMQWTGGPQAGFTSGTPWLPVNENYPRINVERNLAEADSVLHFYREMTRLRRNPKYSEVFVYGELCPYLEEKKGLMAYIRRIRPELLPEDASPAPSASVSRPFAAVLVAVNMQREAIDIPLPCGTGERLLDNMGPERDGAAAADRCKAEVAALTDSAGAVRGVDENAAQRGDGAEKGADAVPMLHLAPWQAVVLELKE